MKKRTDFLKNMHYGVKNRFSGILKFLRIFWSDLVGIIGFLDAVDMDKLLILSRNDFKGFLNAKNIFNFESITYNVKQRKNVCAGPYFFLRSIY